MATTAVTLNIDNTVINRVLNAISTKYGYTGFLPDGVTPETKPAFVKRWMTGIIIAAVKEQEGNTLAAAAIATNNTDVNTNIIIT